MIYHACGSDIHMISRKRLVNHRQWYCGADQEAGSCNAAKSGRHNSFFYRQQTSDSYNSSEVFKFFMGPSIDTINRDLRVHEHAVADWRGYCTGILIKYIENNMEKIRGPGKILESRSKIREWKFNRGHWVEGQWVFGSIEGRLRCCFMVAVHDRSAWR